LRRASNSDDDAVMHFAAGEVFQCAGFEVGAVVSDKSQLIVSGVSKLFVVIFVGISRVSRGDSGEATRSYQIRYKHVYILIKIEFNEQFIQGLSPKDQSSLQGFDCVRCAR